MWLQKFWHKTLGVPYTLHVRERKRIRGAKTTVVFLHGIGNSGAAWKEVTDVLAKDKVNIIVVDLLGFGQSPKPAWAQYDAAMQARALAKTLAMRGVMGKVVLVGHSMGALIAIEYAKRFESRVSRMVLCSPPLYDDKTRKYMPERDQQLKKLYDLMTNYPTRLIQAGNLAKKYGLIGDSFHLTHENIRQYISALKTAIISQTSLKDIAGLSLPIAIIYGTLDPLVVGGRLKKLAKNHSNIQVSSFIGSHEIEGRYVPRVVALVKNQYTQ